MIHRVLLIAAIVIIGSVVVVVLGRASEEDAPRLTPVEQVDAGRRQIEELRVETCAKAEALPVEDQQEIEVWMADECGAR